MNKYLDPYRKMDNQLKERIEKPFDFTLSNGRVIQLALRVLEFGISLRVLVPDLDPAWRMIFTKENKERADKAIALHIKNAKENI